MTRTSFTIADPSGARSMSVSGYLVGPFGINKLPKGSHWRVTHLASGFGMSNLDSRTLKEAKRKALEAYRLPIDWTASFERLQSGDAGMPWRDAVDCVRTIAVGGTAQQALAAVRGGA